MIAVDTFMHMNGVLVWRTEPVYREVEPDLPYRPRQEREEDERE